MVFEVFDFMSFSQHSRMHTPTFAFIYESNVTKSDDVIMAARLAAHIIHHSRLAGMDDSWVCKGISCCRRHASRGYSMECMCFSWDNPRVTKGGKYVHAFLDHMRTSQDSTRYKYQCPRICSTMNTDRPLTHQYLYPVPWDMQCMPTTNNTLSLTYSGQRTHNSSLPGRNKK